MLEFDHIGVVIEKDSAGKYAAKLVVIKNNQVIDLLTLTEDRALSPALRVAREGLDNISMKLSRGEYRFVDKSVK